MRARRMSAATDAAVRLRLHLMSQAMHSDVNLCSHQGFHRQSCRILDNGIQAL
jgi:hypothetical protein